MSGPKVVVCGTAFGRFYLRAVHEAPDYELVGVLARGSAASRKCAAEYGVPCYTDVDQLPSDVDIACVVVKAAVAGGSGALLAQRLLARGVHVLQEHLLHADELAACVRTAREHGVQYRMNAFYPHLEPVRCFLRAAQSMRQRQRLLFLDAACGVQVLYPLLDVLARAVGTLRPWGFADPVLPPREVLARADTGFPYLSVPGVIGGVPLSLRVQNQINPADSDNHALQLHRISLGCEGGALSLPDTHGPVLWSPRLHSDRDADGRLVLDGPGTERLGVPSTEPLGGGPGTFREVFDRLWPQAVRHALDELCEGIARPELTAREAQWCTGVSRMWHDLNDRLGAAELIHPATPEPLPLPEILGVRA